jgi:hypothetical protein
MKTRLLFSVLFTFVFYLLSSQVPQGFNYQAIARNSQGKEIVNTALQVKVSILSDTTGFYVTGGGTYIWEEQQNVTTNSFGLFTILFGSTTATKTLGTAASFSAIDWKASPLYIGTKIYYTGSWKYLGTTRLGSVPYSMVSGGISGALEKLAVRGNVSSPFDSALFEVKNKTGQTIFAVYNEGVRMYVDDGIAKSSTKGGFAIGGFGTVKAPGQEYFRVTRDSTRVYVNSLVKNIKGGFAIGGFSPVKGGVDNFLNLNPANYFIGNNSGKFITTGLYNSALGFESGLNLSSGGSNAFMGYQSGYNNTTGSSNLFLGYRTGYSNTTGNYNSFVGYKAGFSNTGGINNSFIGSFSGQNNTTGNYNTFVGDSSGFNNTIGENNSFIGTKAGFSNITGYSNSFIGNYTGHANAGGSENVFIGNFSGYSNINSWGNVIIGNRAGYLSTAGWNNVYIGTETGSNNLDGYGNVFIGYQTGINNIHGKRNIFIGNTAGFNQQGSNRLIINNLDGDSSQVFIWGNMESHLLRFNANVGIGTNPDWHNLSINSNFGRATIDLKGPGDDYEYSTLLLESDQGPASRCYGITHAKNHIYNIYYSDGTNFPSRFSIDSLGKVSIGETAVASEMLDVNGNARFRAVASGTYSAPLNITSNGTLTTSTSDISMKKNIVSINDALQKVLEMNAVYFSWKNDLSGNRRLGFIAQEMEKVVPEVVFTNPVDSLKGINYPELTAVLAQAIKEQQQQIDIQKKEIDELKSLVNSLISNQSGNIKK